MKIGINILAHTGNFDQNGVLRGGMQLSMVTKQITFLK